MRAVCYLAEKWLHTTPSRALALLSENEEDFDVMLAWKAYDSFETNWSTTSRENKIRFIQIAKTLRRQQGRMLDDEHAEEAAMYDEAREISFRHRGDPSRPPDDDLETKVQTAVRQNADSEQQKPPPARFGRP